MNDKLKLHSVMIMGKPFINNKTKPDRRFKTGVRIIGTKPSVSYTIDIITDNPDNIIRVGETIITTIDTFRVTQVDNINNKVYMRCVCINIKDHMNFNIQSELRFKLGVFTVGEGSGSTTRRL